MLRTTDHCKEYKNGNIIIKYDRDMIAESKRNSLLTLSSVLDEIDCSFIGETYRLNNYATGHTIYNVYSDLVYIFDWNLLAMLENGETIRLYAHKPDEADRELIEMEGM